MVTFQMLPFFTIHVFHNINNNKSAEKKLNLLESGRGSETS